MNEEAVQAEKSPACRMCNAAPSRGYLPYAAYCDSCASEVDARAD